MDDANWGNTRVVVGEGKEKKVIADAEDHYDDSMIPLKRFSGTYCNSADIVLVRELWTDVLFACASYRIRTGHLGGERDGSSGLVGEGDRLAELRFVRQSISSRRAYHGPTTGQPSSLNV